MVIFISLLLCICIAGCGATSNEVDTKNEAVSSTTKAPESTEITGNTSNTTTTKKAKKTIEKTTEQGSTKAEKSTTKAPQGTTKPTEKVTTKKAEKVTEKASVCTITIECKAVLNNMDKLADGHEKYVPKDGYIIKNYECEIDEDITVFDVLSKVCKTKKINLNASKTGYGIYVAGINNLDEFDCGSTSGWLYYVNGERPPYTCGKYRVSKGDKIVFSYTC